MAFLPRGFPQSLSANPPGMGLRASGISSPGMRSARIGAWGSTSTVSAGAPAGSQRQSGGGAQPGIPEVAADARAASRARNRKPSPSFGGVEAATSTETSEGFDEGAGSRTGEGAPSPPRVSSNGEEEKASLERDAGSEGDASGVCPGNWVGSTHSVNPAKSARPLPRTEVSGFPRLPIAAFQTSRCLILERALLIGPMPLLLLRFVRLVARLGGGSAPHPFSPSP